MASNGIMQDIRDLLSQGHTSSQVIALGNKPSTVYKVQRQLRQKQQRNGTAPAQAAGQVQPPNDPELPEESNDENYGDGGFLDYLFGPVKEPTESDRLRGELDRARRRIEELELKAGKVHALQIRVQGLEAENEVISPLIAEVRQLEGELEQANQSQAALRQDNFRWESNVQKEQSGRQADRQEAFLQQVEELRIQISQWQQAHQTLQSQLDASAQVIAALHANLQQLEPLKAWSGHRCAVCHLPMSGSVSRELAADLQKGLAHHACLEQQGSGLGKMLLAAAAAYGLTQVVKK
jgi:DNA repair exonuclease SbcCD ATPase subunit